MMLRRRYPGLDERARRAASARNALHSVALVAGIGLVMGTCAYIVWEGRGVLWTFGAVLALLFIGPRFAPEMVMRAFKARPLPPHQAPDLYEVVRVLALRAGLPTIPRLYVIPSRTLNAFAVGQPDSSSLAITEGMLETLDIEELAGVLAHEISHVRNNDLWIMGLADIMSRLTRIMGYLAVILTLLNLPLAFLGQEHAPWIVVLLLYSAPAISTLLQLALARTREYDADVEGARLTGNPRALASALAKLDLQQREYLDHMLPIGKNSVSQPSVLRSHPDTEERIRRLLELEGRMREPDGFAAERLYWPWTSWPGLAPPRGRPRRRPRSRFWP